MKKYFYDVEDSGKVFLWCLVVPQLIGLIAQIILSSIAQNYDTTISNLLENIAILIPYLMITQISFFIVFWCYSRKFHNVFALKLNHNIGTKNTVICIFIAILALGGFTILVSSFDELARACGLVLNSEFYYDINSFGLLILTIVLFAIIPAILEELIFRGIIFQGLKSLGFWPSALITSLLFTLMHGSLSQFIYPFIVSIILCYVVYKTNSLYSSMLIHLISNTISIILIYANLSFELNVSLVALVFIGLGIALASSVMIWFLCKFLTKAKTHPKAQQIINNINFNELPPTNKLGNKYLKWAILLGIVFFALSVISVITSTGTT